MRDSSLQAVLLSHPFLLSPLLFSLYGIGAGTPSRDFILPSLAHTMLLWPGTHCVDFELSDSSVSPPEEGEMGNHFCISSVRTEVQISVVCFLSENIVTIFCSLLCFSLFRLKVSFLVNCHCWTRLDSAQAVLSQMSSVDCSVTQDMALSSFLRHVGSIVVAIIIIFIISSLLSH